MPRTRPERGASTVVTPARRLFILVYACSGAAGLAYEIVWTRLLTLQFGHTVPAAGVVLASFMGGLAAGALGGGAIAPRLHRVRAITLYAAVEMFVAAFALALPLALRATGPLLAWAYGSEPGARFAIVRLAVSLLLIFIPAAAMGATFPLAVRWFARESQDAARDAGTLYAVNTIGAAFAALLTGFLLVPDLGLSRTTFVAVALNGVAAIGALIIASRSASQPVAQPDSKMAGRMASRAGSRRPRAPVQSATTWLAAAALGVSGFVALVYEVTFTRTLALALGPTSYAFSAMLAAFIAGLAIGAAAMSQARTGGWLALAFLMFAGAAAASGAGWFAGTMLPLLVADAVVDPAASPNAILAREALYAVAVLLPLGCALGALFPVAIRLTHREGAVEHDASVVYGVNTVGAVAGSLAGAFLLIPAMGLQDTLRAAGLTAIAAACVVLAAARLGSGRRAIGVAAGVCAGALVWCVPSWDVNLLSSGGYKYAFDVEGQKLNLATGLKAGRLVYYKEGATSAVSVRQLAGTTALAIDGKIDASNGADMLTQKLLAHLPLLLHGDPKEICIIGLGSGVTLGSALQHDIARADVVEISPEVVKASAFFAHENGRALDDPRTRLIVSDGRSHLQLTARHYDVIISEPSNPWMAGVASLFTREFFVSARARLAPGGVICQWAHTYDIADADLRSIAATFASVFPRATMWLIGDGDLLFVATNDSDGPRLGNIGRAWEQPPIAADLAAVSVLDPFGLLSLYAGGPEELRRYTAGALVQTDDRMQLEFSGPRSVYNRTAPDNAPAVRKLLDRAAAPAPIRASDAAAGDRELGNVGQMFLQAHAYGRAYESFSRAVQLNPDNDAALSGLLDAAGAAERLTEAQRLLESLAGSGRRPKVHAALARLLAASGAFEPAAAQAREFVALEPADPRSMELLASVLADAGDLNGLRPLVARMEQMNPKREETSYYAAMVSFLAGNPTAAIARAEEIVHSNPRHAAAQNLIGSASASLGRRDRARTAFLASLEADPREASTYVNLGLLERESGNEQGAIEYFAEALTLDPGDQRARTSLAAAQAALRR